MYGKSSLHAFKEELIMNNNLLSKLVLWLFIAVLLISLIPYFFVPSMNLPKAKNGYLDLSTYHFDNGKPVAKPCLKIIKKHKKDPQPAHHPVK